MRTSVFLALLFSHLAIPAEATEVLKLALDDATALGTTVSTDSEVRFEGSSAIRISTLWPTTICLGQVSDLRLENTRLLYQAMVKSEELEGVAFLEMWCEVGDGRYFSRGMNSVVTGTTDWERLQTPFILQRGQTAKKITFNIVVNGNGTVWVDALRLVREPID